ncbi:MAG: hypothetical protein C0605_06320 [Hyphomicrobiales bacterium]|nr:MAG: hypothetical protein C0605_06320 [Hyphomicrobiales bacterium]
MATAKARVESASTLMNTIHIVADIGAKSQVSAFEQQEMILYHFIKADAGRPCRRAASERIVNP